MKVLKINLLLACLFGVFASYGQMATLRGAGNSVIMKNTYTEIDGSPFLYEEYKTGTVTDVDGHKEPSLLIKYDIYVDKVVVFKDNQHMVLNEAIYPEFTLSFYGDNNETVTRHFVHSTKLSNPGASGYYEVLYDGEYKLLIKHEVSFINKVVSEYGTTSEIKRFTDNQVLLLLSPDKRLTEMKGGKSAYFDAFIGNAGKVKNIAKKNDLNVKRNEDLIKLIQILEREGIF